MSSSDEENLVQENEFENRDEQGLKTGEAATEKAETKKYCVMLLLVVPAIGQALSWGIYFLCDKALGMHDLMDKKFSMLNENQLGYIYLAAWIIAMTRACLIVNANGARSPARVERPDQHVYKVMSAAGKTSAKEPYVMMATTGPQGRFNRAQRGVFNMDEALPLVVVNILLAGFVFGPVIVVVCLLIALGRVIFGLKYKESLKARTAGFLPAMVGEKVLEGLVLLCAIKSIGGI